MFSVFIKWMTIFGNPVTALKEVKKGIQYGFNIVDVALSLFVHKQFRP